MLLGILLAFLILVCIALGGVVLLQRSEGGALGMGGSPGGFMTARGAGDLLTRTTWILAALFFTLCLGLTILQGRMHKGASVVERLRIDPMAATQPVTPAAPASAPAAPAQDGFGAPLPEVHTAPAGATAPIVAAPVAAAPRVQSGAPAAKPMTSKSPAPATAKTVAPTPAAPLPTVKVAPAQTTHPATTPPDTGTGPTDPVAKTVGGLPSPAPNTPGPRAL